MINLTIGEHEPQEIKLFPKLMITKEGLIVFFVQPKIGAVIAAKREPKDEAILSFANDWIMSAFADYNGEVTLKNA
jgi:hypothetical protein